jgi:hypothetical protein
MVERNEGRVRALHRQLGHPLPEPLEPPEEPETKPGYVLRPGETYVAGKKTVTFYGNAVATSETVNRGDRDVTTVAYRTLTKDDMNPDGTFTLNMTLTFS